MFHPWVAYDWIIQLLRALLNEYKLIYILKDDLVLATDTRNKYQRQGRLNVETH